MRRNEDIEKIDRYINGLADESESRYVESMFLNGEKNLYLHNSLKKDWDQTDSDAAADEIILGHLLDRIHHIIRMKEALKKHNPFQQFKLIYTKVAAVILIPVLLAGGLVYVTMSTQNRIHADKQVSTMISAPMGARVSFNLPDGTKGMLNSGSSLTYSLPFTSNRHIILEGEAFLNVTHDEKHPFDIKAGNSTVEVLGTTLNINAYPVENYIEVVLQTGKVNFTDNKGNEKTTLLPSERLVYEDGKTTKSFVDTTKYIGWTQGKLIFRDDPMLEVVRRIERWYNVEIVLADTDLLRYSFRATFEDDRLEDVLRYLSMTSPIRYTISPRHLMPDGTFKKVKVTIFKLKS
ncbi:MAG: FecR domain-containing protein [Bacteroidales bacterium]